MQKSQIKVGTPVIYWSVILDDGQRLYPFKTHISSEPWELGCGITVCKVEGKSGGIAISHLDVITPGSLLAAKLHGLAEISDEDINASTVKFFKDNGIDVVVS